MFMDVATYVNGDIGWKWGSKEWIEWSTEERRSVQ